MTAGGPSRGSVGQAGATREGVAEAGSPGSGISATDPGAGEGGRQASPLDEGALAEGAAILPGRGGVGLELAFLGIVWVVAAALLWHGVSLQLWRDGTIGPGAYPVFALVGLMALTTGLIVKALAVRQLRLYSPFQLGLQDDLRLRELVAGMARKLDVRISVITKDGEGRFSALWNGIRAGRNTDALAVVSSAMTSLPNFRAAAFCRGRMEPLGGLFFDPDVLVVQPDSPWRDPADMRGAPAPVRLGFGHHEDVEHGVDSWLAATQGLVLQPTYSDDVSILLAALGRGELDGVVLSHSLAWQAISTGQVRCIGIFAEPERQPGEVAPAPAFSDHGPPVVSGHWAALMAPAGMAAGKKAALSAVFAEAAGELAPAGGTDPSARVWRILPRDEMTGIIETQRRCFELLEPGAPARLPAGKIIGLVVAIAGLAIFPFAMTQIGFVLSAFLYLATLALLLWPRLTATRAVISVAVAVFFSIGSYLLFTKVFSVVLPAPALLGGLLP